MKAAVGQVGFAEGDRFLLDCRGYGERVELIRRIAADRKRRALEGVSEKVNPRFLLCSSQSVEFARKRAEANPGAPIVEVTLETAEKTMEYKPLEVVERVAPRALLLIGARDDNVCPIEGYHKLYERAREPKKLSVLPITHYEIYSGRWFEESSGSPANGSHAFSCSPDRSQGARGEERQPVTELFIDPHALPGFVLSSKRRAIASHSARLPVL